jgi:hypothetical protein
MGNIVEYFPTNRKSYKIANSEKGREWAERIEIWTSCGG